jgi:pyrroline-5-carboxylate reductase
MHLFTSIFGSGPAYIMYFIESIIDSGDFDSITSEEKSLLVLNLLNSTSKMLFLNEDIKKLRSRVTSKGGTTEAAITIFEENKLSETIKKAIESAKNKSIEISK